MFNRAMFGLYCPSMQNAMMPFSDGAYNTDTLVKEVERIDEDISTLRQMGVLVCKLHSNHHQVRNEAISNAHMTHMHTWFRFVTDLFRRRLSADGVKRLSNNR